jgi:hypothetical protein
MNPLLAALLLSLASFPPPVRAPVTEAMKCDWGPVVSVNLTEHPTLVVQTPAGPVTYQVSADQPVLGQDKQQHGTVATLKPETRVRVYYVIDNGARVIELDLET